MRLTSLLAVPAIALLTATTPVQAADWPTREIRWIVPFGAGGGADLVARVIAQELSTRLGKQVLVENKPGASSTIGVRQVADAEPDGYTFGVFTAVHPVNIATRQPVPYDADRDLSYLTTLIRTPMVLLANPKRNFKSLDDVVAFAKKNPEALTASSIGPGTPHHLLMEWMAARKGFNISVVPYKTIPQALQAVMAGEVDLCFMGAGGNVDAFVANGSMNLIAVTSTERLARAPDAPTMNELGLPGFPADSWYGAVAPAKTPAEIQKRFADEIRSVLAMPEVRRKLEAGGATPSPSTAAEFAAIVRQDTAKYVEIVETVEKAKAKK